MAEGQTQRGLHSCASNICMLFWKATKIKCCGDPWSTILSSSMAHKRPCINGSFPCLSYWRCIITIRSFLNMLSSAGFLSVSYILQFSSKLLRWIYANNYAYSNHVEVPNYCFLKSYMFFGLSFLSILFSAITIFSFCQISSYLSTGNPSAFSILD